MECVGGDIRDYFGVQKGVFTGEAGERKQRRLRLSPEIRLGEKGTAWTPLKDLEGRKDVALGMGDQPGRPVRRGVLYKAENH